MQKIRQSTRYVVILAMLVTAVAPAVAPAQAQNASGDREAELLAVLRSDAPAAEKAVTCKLLAIHGSSESVPDLAKLLTNAQLASWARIALESIPGRAADEALRNATESLEGILLVGTINSIGVRRDANSVDLLTTRLQDREAEVASAAAVALGRIGNDAATKSLRQALAESRGDVRSAVAEGCVLCAERRHSEGKSSEAVEIYDEIRVAELPQQRIIEATRGAILARGQKGIPLLIEQLQSSDKKMFQLALGTAREFPGGQVDKALAEEMVRAAPERAALIIQAMADRQDTVVLAAVLKAAEQGAKAVRLAAIDSLGQVGDATCLTTLLGVALEADADLTESARTTLANLPDPKVDGQIVELMRNAEGPMVPLLLELIGERRIDAVPVLLEALDHSDRAVRTAALTALGETISLANLSVLITRVVAPQYSEDAQAAREALKAASVRMPDREACADELAAAIERAGSESTRGSLLEILGAVGGTKALATMHIAAKSDDAELQDISTRLLGTWMTQDAAPVLLDLAKTAPGEKYKVRALRGYIRIARQFVLPERQRAEMCEKALETAWQTAEQKLVLDVLKRYPNPESLRLAVKATQVPEIKQEATQAVLAIAQKLGNKGTDVRFLLTKSGLDKVKLEIVKAEYGAGSTKKDVTAVLRKQAGDLPVIALESTSYNTSFGGDPLPGTAKRLTIQYRINGKDGEASFAENSLIILPIPQ